MLIINNICKSFGKIKAVDEVSLKFDKNETAVLLGENGAGKSTLFKIISGFLEPDSGEALFENENIKNIRTKYLQNKRACAIIKPKKKRRGTQPCSQRKNIISQLISARLRADTFSATKKTAY